MGWSVRDERLVLQSLKNIRIVYIIQTIGILGTLGFDLVTKGLDEMRDNPLWLLFMVTAVISAYLSMSISADHEKNTINRQKSLAISLVVLVSISTVVGFFVSITEGFNRIDGLIMGGILFICGLFPIIYIYKLRKKRQDDDE